jgi:hypothetical protein
MSTPEFRLGGRRPPTNPCWMNEPPEVKKALARAEEFAARAASANYSKEREYCERMSRKWLGLADGWRVIVEVDKP